MEDITASGLFPDLSTQQKSALVESLKAERSREQIVSGIQHAAADFGNLAAIATNIGLSADLIKGMQGAQIAATGTRSICHRQLSGCCG